MQHSTRQNDHAQITADAHLPDEIRPPNTPHAQQHSSHALITGATGFLGRYVVRSLLTHTTLHLSCLIRADNPEQAQQRLNNALAQTGNITPDMLHRISVVCGDLTQPKFGLSHTAYVTLAASTGTVYHCAALVNWARSYRKLRHINVLGTLEVIRFACHVRSKALLFVSSIAVCYTTQHTQMIDENTDMLPHIKDMPLGYAQSKCVAENLLKQAAQRGLSVTILRPALISGATDSGLSNTEDFVAALLEGCVRTGRAMDEDWLLDFVPVDFVAEVIAKLLLRNSTHNTQPCSVNKHEKNSLQSSNATGLKSNDFRLTMLHLVADRPRHWRELILWLNLYGYPVKLVQPEQWLSQVFSTQQHCGKRLYTYRRFFQGLPGQTADTRPYECYLQAGQQRIDSSASIEMLTKTGLTVPTLDATLLQRYLHYFQQSGLLPELPTHLHAHKNNTPDLAVLLKILQQKSAAALQPIPLQIDNGILNQIAAAYGGTAIGLRAYRIVSTATEVVVKTKCGDALVEDSTVQMAALCSPTLGKLFQRFRTQLGLSGAQQREAALYELPSPTLRRYTPHCFGTQHNPHSGLTTIVLEKLNGTTNKDCWQEAQIYKVIAGLAEIQTLDHEVLQPLIQSGLLKQERSTETMLEMVPLWRELAQFAAVQSNAAAQLLPLQNQYIESLAAWWPQLLSQPQCLIHNDFNPRNLILRSAPRHSSAQNSSKFPSTNLCVYDWELAVIGAPQRDLAEFLCFVLNTEQHTADTVHALIEEHRQHYNALAKTETPTTEWLQGFNLALRQFVITRLPMYALMHRFRPQPFLTTLNTNALWLLQLTSPRQSPTD